MARPMFTYWSMTINNPTDADMVLVRNPNEKYIRQFIWTPEQGESGTPHVQAYIRLHRNQPVSFVSKLYPRASLKGCSSDEHEFNVSNYAQKDDPTTRGPHTNTLFDPLPSADTLLVKVLSQVWEDPDFLKQVDNPDDIPIKLVSKYKDLVERRFVSEKPMYMKVFVSPVYERCFNKFYHEIFSHLMNTTSQDARSRSSSDNSSCSSGSQQI